MTRLGALLMTAALAPAGAAADRPAWSADLQATADGANRFAFDLYAQVRSGTGSRFVSPYSVHAAFALLTGGAKGRTRDELVRGLHLPADVDRVGDLGRYYAAGGTGYELSVANALWGQAGYPWDAGFQARAAERFGAKLQPVDFRGDPEGARAAANAWAADRTRNRIPELLPASAVTPRSRLILANAVYFKGDWAQPFKAGATKPDLFTRADGSKGSVPLMTRTGRYRHARADGCQVLELPYAGGELAMDVVLPGAATGLPAAEKLLTAAGFGQWLGKLRDEPLVQVYLPKFKVEVGVTLPPVLKARGVREVFSPDGADLGGLTSGPGDDRLSVSDAFHKAFVEVGEQGTEAAAATGIVAATRSVAPVAPTPVLFRADRPFLFVIRDVKHGTVLFVGRYAGPG